MKSQSVSHFIDRMETVQKYEKHGKVGTTEQFITISPGVVEIAYRRSSATYRQGPMAKQSWDPQLGPAACSDVVYVMSMTSVYQIT